MEMLLTRDAFREGVFDRDNKKCVFCEKAAVDAHHILERRLFDDGGYYLSNGASVCEDHHLLCEMTLISTKEVREAAGITNIILPPHLYMDAVYDKWGNIVMPNGTRLKGELFFDESVQKILAAGNVLPLFIDYVKYPRTYHLPWSPGVDKSDRVHADLSFFNGQEIVVTAKLDGENTSLYPDYIHARSIDSGGHASRAWVKNYHAGFSFDIPPGYRICGENLYAKHSIFYQHLKTYFYGFSMWDDRNYCLSWDETLEWFDLLGIVPVPLLYRGIYDEALLKTIYKEKLGDDEMEGFVVRLAAAFSYSRFRHAVAKYVRAGHVNSSRHWRAGQPLIPNKLAR